MTRRDISVVEYPAARIFQLRAVSAQEPFHELRRSTLLSEFQKIES